jgi:P-type E1-E2 ATPase
VTLALEIPGRPLELEHLLLDVNGTLSDRGRLLPGVAEGLAALSGSVEIHLLSADTFGTLEEIGRSLGVSTRRVRDGEEKLALLESLGADRCAAIGNGANDVPMLSGAALALAVLGPEGAAAGALAAADVVCRTIGDALAATLRP